MTPLEQAILNRANALYVYGEQCRKEGYSAGWAAAMASMKRERDELGERLSEARTSEEMMEAVKR